MKKYEFTGEVKLWFGRTLRQIRATIAFGDVKAGDEVVALGGTGKYAVTPDDWAALKGTHAYDIICSFGNRVERVYRP